MTSVSFSTSFATLVPAGGLLPAGPAGDAPALLRAVAGAAPAVLAAGPSDGVPFVDTALRLVLLTALAVVAGSGLVRVLADAPDVPSGSSQESRRSSPSPPRLPR